jgi:hypothetical protein
VTHRRGGVVPSSRVFLFVAIQRMDALQQTRPRSDKILSELPSYAAVE